MKFSISGFTNKGTKRTLNQDGIFVNGTTLYDGEIHLNDQKNCICFVADGVGGSNSGEYASHFVLEGLRNINFNSISETINSINCLNEELISSSINDIKLRGSSTTLTGIHINDLLFHVFHVGDSQLWLLRNNMFFKITTDQVLDQEVVNSPITSYLGGTKKNLIFGEIDFSTKVEVDDTFLICSDGLFKSLTMKVVKSILSSGRTIEDKSRKILENSLTQGSDDNVSVILINLISK